MESAAPTSPAAISPMAIIANLTAASAALLRLLRSEAWDDNAGTDRVDWTPLPTLTAAQRGNLTDLKKRGLVETWDDEDPKEPTLWYSLSDAGQSVTLPEPKPEPRNEDEERFVAMMRTIPGTTEGAIIAALDYFRKSA